MITVQGMDTSHYSDESSSDPYPDYAKGKDKYAFNIPKASEGQTLHDEEFAPTITDMKRLDKPWGAFHFYRSRTAALSPIKQAENFWSVIEPQGLPPIGSWLDCETTDENLSINMYLDHVWKFIQRYETLSGTILGIYTRKGFWDRFANATHGYSDIPKNRKLWVANYAVSYPHLPLDWEHRYGPDYFTFWQNGTYVVPGFKSPVDSDLYHGSAGDFNHEFGTDIDDVPPVPTPTPPPTTPDRIKIAGLVPGDTLKLRYNVWGTEIGRTPNGSIFSVEDTTTDADGRVWYKVGRNIYLASWYAQPI